MKSKQVCFDPATGRMNLKRFAPAIVLYTLLLLTTTVFVFAESFTYGHSPLFNVQDYTKLMAGYNFVYAFVMAQLLFGDLYNTRLSYAIHALPITKGGFYGTQIILGLMGNLIPNCLNAALMLVLMSGYRITVLWWLLASLGQFLFFFGVAALSAICAGNRIGQMLMDGILNFLAMLFWWFQINLYVPMLFGLTQHSSIGLLRFSPFCIFVDEDPFRVLYSLQKAPEGYYDHIPYGVEMNAHYYIYLAVCAVLGCAAIWLGMKLFRKRRAECAGDLLAFDCLKPAFVILFTLTCGGFAHLASYVFNGLFSIPMLFIGMILGYYAGQMLLMRQVDVLKKAKLAPLAALCGVMFLSIALTRMDVLGFSRKVPDPAEVTHIRISAYDPYNTEDPEEIRQILALQEEIIAQRQNRFDAQSLLTKLFADKSFYPESEDYNTLIMETTLQDGSVIRREYPYNRQSSFMPQIRQYMSKPEVIFVDALSNYRNDLITSPLRLDDLANGLLLAELRCTHRSEEPSGDFPQALHEDSKIIAVSDPEELQGLWDAVLSDCEAGNLAQLWVFHEDYDPDYLYFTFRVDGIDGYVGASVNLFDSCVNTLHWLQAHGYHD